MKAFAALKSTKYKSLNERLSFCSKFWDTPSIKRFRLCLDAWPFQQYFFNNLFNPDENSRIKKHNKLTNKTTETVNKIFTLGQEQNKKQIQQYIKQMNIRLEWTNLHLSKEKQSRFIQNCWF